MVQEDVPEYSLGPYDRAQCALVSFLVVMDWARGCSSLFSSWLMFFFFFFLVKGVGDNEWKGEGWIRLKINYKRFFTH